MEQLLGNEKLVQLLDFGLFGLFCFTVPAMVGMRLFGYPGEKVCGVCRFLRRVGADIAGAFNQSCWVFDEGGSSTIDVDCALDCASEA